MYTPRRMYDFNNFIFWDPQCYVLLFFITSYCTDYSCILIFYSPLKHKQFVKNSKLTEHQVVRLE